MKLLFDENLSRKLAVCLGELYPGSAHVENFDLLSRSDRDIWDFAGREGFIIVTADADFYELATTLDRRPKWYGSGDGPTRPETLSSSSGATQSESPNLSPRPNSAS